MRVRKLLVLYDGECRICRFARAWLERQPQFTRLEFAPSQTGALGLGGPERPLELIVVAPGGAVFRGPKAWLMILWALERYRAWATTLARPGMWRYARGFIEWMSRREAGRHGYKIRRGQNYEG
jgi:predicted DCC family thiol-disulfide oxidoreductase YuxK